MAHNIFFFLLMFTAHLKNKILKKAVLIINSLFIYHFSMSNFNN